MDKKSYLFFSSGTIYVGGEIGSYLVWVERQSKIVSPKA